MAIVGNQPTPPEYWRWKLAEKFGWTLDYIDALSIGDFNEYIQVADGTAKGLADRPKPAPQRRK